MMIIRWVFKILLLIQIGEHAVISLRHDISPYENTFYAYPRNNEIQYGKSPYGNNDYLRSSYGDIYRNHYSIRKDERNDRNKYSNRAPNINKNGAKSFHEQYKSAYPRNNPTRYIEAPKSVRNYQKIYEYSNNNQIYTNDYNTTLNQGSYNTNATLNQGSYNVNATLNQGSYNANATLNQGSYNTNATLNQSYYTSNTQNTVLSEDYTKSSYPKYQSSKTYQNRSYKPSNGNSPYPYPKFNQIKSYDSQYYQDSYTKNDQSNSNLNLIPQSTKQDDIQKLYDAYIAQKYG